MRSARGGSSRALVRHVKLTNRSGLASFRIPRGHRVGPSSAQQAVCTPRPSLFRLHREFVPGKREREREEANMEGPVTGPATLATVRPVVRALSIRIHYRGIRFSTIPDALPPITGHAWVRAIERRRGTQPATASVRARDPFQGSFRRR